MISMIIFKQSIVAQATTNHGNHLINVINGSENPLTIINNHEPQSYYFTAVCRLFLSAAGTTLNSKDGLHFPTESPVRPVLFTLLMEHFRQGRISVLTDITMSALFPIMTACPPEHTKCSSSVPFWKMLPTRQMNR